MTEKTPEQVDAIMSAIPEEWRGRWCGGEYGACACLGCAQIGNRAVIHGKVFGKRYIGDPEYISEAALRQRDPTTYADNKLSKADWDSWMARQSAPRR